MNCREFETHVESYVDGELAVRETLAADAHRAGCPECAGRAQRERELRQLLRRQPREAAPPELRTRILADIRRVRPRRSGAWLGWPALGAAAAAVVVAVLGAAALLPALRAPSPLVAQLVDKHITYAQLERPAELATDSGTEAETWLYQRAGFRVLVPDYSPAGIRLVGARLAEARERPVAYLLYEKGRTLMSVFAVPGIDARTALRGSTVSYRGEDYAVYEWKGYRTVAWTEGQMLFGFVSMLDYDALLECADRLRLERARGTRL